MAVRKKKTARKATAKAVKTLAKKSAKGDAKLKKADAKLKKTDAKLKSDLVKLKGELAKLKKNPKIKKRELNEYTLFMRKQLRTGKNFKQAIVAWNRFKKLQNKRKPSAYNSFLASQLKQGRSFKQAVSFWKAQKKALPGKKTGKRKLPRQKKAKAMPKRKTRAITKIKRVIVKQKPKTRTRAITKIKRVVVKAKPKIQYRTRTKIVEKPVVVETPTTASEKIIEQIVSAQAPQSKAMKEPLHGLPLEEIAYRMLRLYFEELARHGIKRSVSLSELVDIYQYSLGKISQKLGKPEKSLLHEEEISYRLVKLYFLELARFGKKRTTSLDELLEAYFFVLSRIAPSLQK